MSRQRFLSETVVEAARRRVAFAFDHFDEVIVSISGGKDSTVLAHLALQEAVRRGRRAGLLFLDEEVVYQSTVEQVEYLMDLEPAATNRMWLQFPFLLTNAASLTEGQLVAWEPGKHKLWMRPRRKDSILGKPWDPETETVRNRKKGDMIGFYDVIENFERSRVGAAFLTGERGAESPNRWRSVVKHPVEIGGQRTHWATRRGENVVMKPLFDWNFHDVWRYIAEHELRYSKIYDFMFMKGMPVGEIRCSSLLHERSLKSLVELPEFEPKTYDRLLRRVKGIAYAQELGKDAKAMRARKLPRRHATWRAYRDFLLATHPDLKQRGVFERRFARHLDNEHVARQQVRQLLLNDYENNLPVDNKPDPRDELLAHYRRVL